MSNGNDHAADIDGRTRHYGRFYGLEDPDPGEETGPFVTVVGNCQGESLRLLLASTGRVASFRIPPVHEWVAADLPHLEALLARTDVLVTQPVHDGYRDLPIGTAQLSRLLPDSAQVIRYPVLRYDGLFPYHAIVRPPSEPSLDPPVVPYHDLRILVAAHRGLDAPAQPTADATALRAAAAMSVDQLRQRENRHHTVVVSDALEAAPAWHTLNHPDNATLAVAARRVLERMEELGLCEPGGQVTPPADREMLGGFSAPVDPAAAEALGVPEKAVGREDWRDGGAVIPAATILEAQLEFYRRHPEIVTAGLRRHADRIRALGLDG